MIGFGFGFNLFSGMIKLIMLVIFIFIGYVIVRGISDWNRNNHAPISTVPSKVVSKRQQFHKTNTSGYTNCYVTFELQCGERMELAVPDEQYGYLVEGDCGMLTFQGSRYKGFQTGNSW